ncbi:hypothetical protein [Amnibacterium sp.]|uniref:hypothetical protein n=1 Tax=Amnibacterium sp. TaxID=1872496 RepID=UPI0026101839|nr:hypothetical protein [Amnibacterium sp.]MCU1474231.1 hypothetical protein [Amnibacterium sp.]
MTATDDGLLALLEESGLPADDELTGLLAELRSLGTDPVPAPGPELAALLIEDRPGRRGLHRRGAVIGALVVLSLGSGVTAAAASPGVRDGAAGAVAAVVQVLQHGTVAPKPHRSPAPRATPADVRIVVPVASSAPLPGTPAHSVVPAVPVDRSSASADARHGSRSDDGSGGGAGRSGDEHGSSGSGSGSSGSGTSGSSGSGTSGSGHGTGSSGSSGSGDSSGTDDSSGSSGSGASGSGDSGSSGSGDHGGGSGDHGGSSGGGSDDGSGGGSGGGD